MGRNKHKQHYKHEFYRSKSIDEMIVYYVKQKSLKEDLSSYEVDNLITYWRNRVKTFHYFVLICYKNNTPIYYSISTGLTNAFFDSKDLDAEIMNMVYLHVIKKGNYTIINPNNVVELEDAYLAYEESYKLKDNQELMTKSLKRILNK